MKQTKRHFSAVKFWRWYKKNSGHPRAMSRPSGLSESAVVEDGRRAYEEGRDNYEMRGSETTTGRPEIFSFR